MRSRRVPLLRLVLATAILVTGVLATAPLRPSNDAAAAATNSTLGVYRGARKITEVGEFGQWLGASPTWALDFFAGDSWTSIESPTWWLNGWGSSGYRMVYSVPMLPSSGATIAEGAAGAYGGHWAKLAQTLIAAGQADAILRIGWEFNGRWYVWSAKDNPGAWAEYWRRIVTAMRAVPGADFRFEWNPTLGTASVAPALAYPGDQYVDFIGTDVYDQEWITGWEDPMVRWDHMMNQPYGLKWHRDFAAAHGKPMTFPEWGLVIRSDGHGGGDNPGFIQKMYDWINQNNVAYHLYFEYDASDGAHRMMTGQFPVAGAKYRELFGGASSGTASAGSGSTTTSTTGGTSSTSGAGPDTIAPVIGSLLPTTGTSYGRGTRITASAVATDNSGKIRDVAFYLDGKWVCTDTAASYTCSISLRRGTHAILAVATDAAGNAASVTSTVAVRR